MKGGGRQALTDLSDIANNNNSVAARALRECILTLLPVWFRDEAESLAAKTLAGDSAGEPLPKRIADAVAWFGRELGVTVEQLETRLGRPRAKWTAGNLATLNVLGSEIGRGEKDVEEEFPDTPVDLAALPGRDEAVVADAARAAIEDEAAK
jgi:hypothetical protein